MSEPQTRSVQQLMDLSGRTALVTGGSRGLGLQMAQALGEAGARLVISSRKANELEEAAEQLRAAGIDVTPLAVDLADEDAVMGLADRALGHTDGAGAGACPGLATRTTPAARVQTPTTSSAVLRLRLLQQTVALRCSGSRPELAAGRAAACRRGWKWRHTMRSWSELLGGRALELPPALRPERRARSSSPAPQLSTASRPESSPRRTASRRPKPGRWVAALHPHVTPSPSATAMAAVLNHAYAAAFWRSAACDRS